MTSLLALCPRWLACSDASPNSRRPRARTRRGAGPLPEPPEPLGWVISSQFGNPNVAPGDTFGIATLSPTELVSGWGSELTAPTVRRLFRGARRRPHRPGPPVGRLGPDAQLTDATSPARAARSF